MKERPIRVPISKLDGTLNKDVKFPNIDTSGIKRQFVGGKVPGLDLNAAYAPTKTNK